MTVEQLVLIEQPPKLTGRQADALQHLKAAGPEGITGSELGRALGVSEQWAKSNGLQVLKALKAKGLVEQKRGGIWRAIGATTPADDGVMPRGMTDEIPY